MHSERRKICIVCHVQHLVRPSSPLPPRDTFYRAAPLVLQERNRQPSSSSTPSLFLLPPRHVCHQVMDTQGKIAGLLDIAKCLYDAVTRLGKAAHKKATEEEAADDGGSTVMIGAVLEAAKAMNMKGKASAQNQKALQVTRRGINRELSAAVEDGGRLTC